MRKIFYDILPDADGWIVSRGGRSLACYPSFRLACEAALAAADNPNLVHNGEMIVVRRQDLDGRMHEVKAPAAFAA